MERKSQITSLVGETAASSMPCYAIRTIVAGSVQ